MKQRREGDRYDFTQAARPVYAQLSSNSRKEVLRVEKNSAKLRKLLEKGEFFIMVAVGTAQEAQMVEKIGFSSILMKWMCGVYFIHSGLIFQYGRCMERYCTGVNWWWFHK